MSELAHNATYTPVSFNALEKPLTKSQQAILDMLIEKQKAKQKISKLDIKNLYVKTVHPTGIFGRWESRWDSVHREWRRVWRDIDMNMSYESDIKSIQWFKNNLATCIIKGKIIAIPIIDI